MIPDLGKYTYVVLSAYGVGILLLAALTILSLLKAKQSKQDLSKLEKRRHLNG